MSLEGRHTSYMHVLPPVGHTAENCFVKKSNEAVETQDVRFAKNSGPTEAKEAVPSGQNNIMFVKEDDSVEE